MGFVRCRYFRLAEFGIKRTRPCEDLGPILAAELLFLLTRTRPQPEDSGSLVHQRVRAVRVIEFDAHDRR